MISISLIPSRLDLTLIIRDRNSAINLETHVRLAKILMILLKIKTIFMVKNILEVRN